MIMKFCMNSYYEIIILIMYEFMIMKNIVNHVRIHIYHLRQFLETEIGNNG